MSLYAMKHDNCPTCTCTQAVQSREHIIDGFKDDFMKDAEEGGAALDGATWKFIQAYSAMLRTPQTEMTFADCKAMVKQSIAEYMERVQI